MRYFIGSAIISFMVLFVLVLMLVAMGIPAPDDIGRYLGGAWLVLTLALLPFAKKIIRVE